MKFHRTSAPELLSFTQAKLETNLPETYKMMKNEESDEKLFKQTPAPFLIRVCFRGSGVSPRALVFKRSHCW